VSVQVVTGQALQVQNTNSLTDLSQVVPQLHIQSSGDQFGQSIAIRGISSGARNSSYDQSVPVFEDDLYYGRSVMTQAAFLDIDHIELLAGPQSTYFGNNAIGGALSLQTKKPDDQFDGYARALYGSYGTYAFETAASLPVNDTLAVRVAGTVNGDTGWIRNVATGQMAPGEENYAGRVTTVWNPNTSFSAILKVEGSSNQISGAYNQTPSQWSLCPTPPGIPKISNFCPYLVAANTAVPGSVPTGFDNNLNSGLGGQFASLKTNTDQLTMNYQLAGLTFTSVTGYYFYHYGADEDNASVGNEWLVTVLPQQRYRQLSQEVRLASATDQPVDFMVGGYYQRDYLDQDIESTVPYFTSTLQALKFAGPFPAGYDIDYTQYESILSGFAAVNWHITDQLKLNLGFRATDVHKDFVGSVSYGQSTAPFAPLDNVYTPAQQAFLGRFLGAPGTFPYTLTNKASMPSVGLQYQLKPEVMLYSTYTRGFLAGGFSSATFTPLTSASGAIIEPTFAPEYVNAYEVGVKSKWLDDRLQVNLDYFRESYKDIQVSAQIGLAAGNYTSAAVNAGGSLSQGVELHAQWLATSNFRIIADVTYLDARYTDFTNAPPTYEQSALKPAPAFQSLNGKPLDFAPDWSGAVTAEYRAPVMGGYKLTGSLTPIFTSSYYNSNGTDDPLFRIPGSVRLDGKLTLDNPTERWAVDLIGRNLTDKVIPLSIGSNTTQGGKEEPRNVAVQFRYRW
jgi:outer membrane receptor protein involved in Fe transport